MSLTISTPQLPSVRFDQIDVGGLCMREGKVYLRIVSERDLNACNLNTYCMGYLDPHAMVQPMEGQLKLSPRVVIDGAVQEQVTASDIAAYHTAQRNGNSGKIHMIKSIRERLHCGLKEAKDMADRECKHLNLE